MGNRVRYRYLAALCMAIALLAAGTSAAGVFLRGDGSTAPAVSIRGEAYQYATTGVYAFNAERVVAEGVGWDAVTLFFAVPLLLLALRGVARGSLKARLIAVGVLGYFLYQYLMYAVFWALGPLFPYFIVLYATSAIAIVWTVSTIDATSLPARFNTRFPRRTMAVYSALMGLMLVGMWVPRIATGLSGDVEGAGLLGTPTLSVQALDLGIIVPLALATAVLTWRRGPWGYLLAAVFSVKAVTMAGAICAMLISAALVEGTLEVGPFAIFGSSTLVAAFIAWRIFGSVIPEPAERFGNAGAGRAATSAGFEVTEDL